MIDLQPDLVFSTPNLNAAIDYSKKNTFEKVPVQFKDIQLSDDGNQLLIQNNPFKVYDSGMENLCSAFKIPWEYAIYVKNTHLRDDIKTLSERRASERIDLYFNAETETLVDANTNIKFMNISNTDFLIKMPEARRIMFANHLLKLEVVGDQAERFEVGHVHKLGSVIYHYPTANTLTHALFQIWTLVCSNGATIPRTFGKERLNLKSKKPFEVLLDGFIEAISRLVLDKDLLKEAFKQLNETPLQFKDLNKILRRFKRTIDEDYESFVGLNIYKEYESIKGELKEDEDDDKMLTASKYDLYYNITDYASNKTNNALVSKKIQMFAGKFLLKKYLED